MLACVRMRAEEQAAADPGGFRVRVRANGLRIRPGSSVVACFSRFTFLFWVSIVACFSKIQ